MNNVLIIGGSGFLGQNIVKKIAGKNVVIYDLFPPRNPLREGFIYIEGSLNDFSKIERVCSEYRIDTIIHAVSLILPNSNISGFYNDISSMFSPTVTLIDYCSKEDIFFVYLSSGGTVYGEQEGRLSETSYSAPISFYGLSKLNVENAILFFHRTQKLRYLIVRPSNPYGIGQNIYGKQGLIAIIFGKIKKNQTISVWGDGSAIRDYIYIEDFAEIIGCLLSKGIENEILNIGSGKGSSINDILEIIKNIHKNPIQIEYIPARNVDVKKVVLDISRLQSKIGKFAFTEIYKGINYFYQEIFKFYN